MFSNDGLESEYTGVWQAWKAGPSPATNQQLLTAVKPVLDTAVKNAGSRPSPTLQSRAKRMALHAFNSYDPRQGNLKTHLLSQLQGLRRHAAKEQQIISMPEQVRLDYMHLLNSERDLQDQLGRDPSDAEIADNTGLSMKRLGYIRQSQLPISEGSVLNRPGETTPGSLPASMIPGKDPAGDAWQSYIYGDLSPVDQAILDYTLGRNGTPKLPTTQIAGKLGITSGAVSQRAAKIQKMLDARHEFPLL